MLAPSRQLDHSTIHSYLPPSSSMLMAGVTSGTMSFGEGNEYAIAAMAMSSVIERIYRHHQRFGHFTAYMHSTHHCDSHTLGLERERKTIKKQHLHLFET